MPKATKHNGKAPVAPPRSQTPPCTPIDESPQHCVQQPITRKDLEDLLLKVIYEVRASKPNVSADPAGDPADPEQASSEDQEKDEKKIHASKAEYKTVDETYANTRIIPRTLLTGYAQLGFQGKVGELDEYAFIIRKRIHKETGEPIVYVDIKSPGLRDIVRVVLKDIRTAGLEADKPAVERNLLYHFLAELKEHLRLDEEQDKQGDRALVHLGLMIQYLEETYQSTSEELTSLLKHRKISYGLLWALFKPGALVYMTCPSTGLSRCVRYSFGEEKRISSGTCFQIHGHYFDFDGEAFGMSTETLSIETFRGAKRLENLPAYPLEYHPDPAIKSRLVARGQKFVSLMGCYHRQYQGNLFVQGKNKLLKIRVNSRIMVDAELFRTMNPNYARLEAKKATVFDILGEASESKSVRRVKGSGMAPNEMVDCDLAICSPTVLGFSLNEKIWEEFAVEDVDEIKFSSTPFDMLTIPEDMKKVIKSLTESRVSATNGEGFDDVIAGKGQGVNILLRGPPGVGKTLTAEAMAEQLERPLYSISSGDLSARAEEMEVQLTRTFRMASGWGAVLVLDEADLERNRLVTTFLRTLQYYRGIFFLTTNRLSDFDEAILDWIDLKLRYDNLDPSARRSIFSHFLIEAKAEVEKEELCRFAEISLNGRQIKNIVKIAHNVAIADGARLCPTHIRTALTANGYTIPTAGALAFDSSLYE
ncbi:MYB DNA-binding domain-containing protein [Paracoccidioides lutzii Pb01]|uniref:MYB DNA-binding domain-containing protein n=1 Tax=Paracoccidioides lutzii (strain ATCC MYA-826 / Pb01) TaxID=502779 RepID=C1H0C7_PARBA|nr:MYB DNA-binding domain-containing protein [Paracoccidioides lutzii Pb01]EEH33168.2 MYB DNA-binding domain-containing protein [Paracoccidioides lutzii Pb01]